MQQHMGLSRKAVPPRIQFQNGYELGFWSAIFFFLKPKTLVKSLAAAFQVRLFDLAKGVEMGELQEHEEWMSHIVWMVLVVKFVVKNDGSMELSKKLLVQWVDFHLVHWCRATQYMQYSHQIAGTFCPTSPNDNRRIPCRRCSSGGQTSSLAAAVARHGIRSGVEDSDPLTGWIYGMILVKLESKDDFMILDLEWPSKDRTLPGMYFSGSASLPQVRLVQLMKTGDWVWNDLGKIQELHCKFNGHECRWSVCKLQESLSKSGTLIVCSITCRFYGTIPGGNNPRDTSRCQPPRCASGAAVTTSATDKFNRLQLFGGFGNLATFPNGWHTRHKW